MLYVNTLYQDIFNAIIPPESKCLVKIYYSARKISINVVHFGSKFRSVGQTGFINYLLSQAVKEIKPRANALDLSTVQALNMLSVC